MIRAEKEIPFCRAASGWLVISCRSHCSKEHILGWDLSPEILNLPYLLAVPQRGSPFLALSLPFPYLILAKQSLPLFCDGSSVFCWMWFTELVSWESRSSQRTLLWAAWACWSSRKLPHLDEFSRLGLSQPMQSKNRGDYTAEVLGWGEEATEMKENQELRPSSLPLQEANCETAAAAYRSIEPSFSVNSLPVYWAELSCQGLRWEPEVMQRKYRERVAPWRKGYSLQHRAANLLRSPLHDGSGSLQEDASVTRSFLQLPVPALLLLHPTCWHKLWSGQG